MSALPGDTVDPTVDPTVDSDGETVDSGVQEGFYDGAPENPNNPTPESESDSKPEDKPEEKPVDKPVEEGPKPVVDKDRQRRDQDRSNERREEKEARSADRKTIADLTDLIKTQAATAPTGPQGPSSREEIETLLESLNAVDGDGNGATAADVGKVMRKIEGIRSSQPAAKSPQMDEIIAGLKKLNERLDASDVRTAASEARTAASESDALLEKMLTGFDKVYGDKYRNDAYKASQQELIDQGFGEDNLPHSNHVRLILDQAYRAAREADPNKGKGPKPKPTIPVDPGAGGNAIPRMRPQGDLNQVIEGMKASGRPEFQDSKFKD